ESLCIKHDWLLIFDEVQTGNGRTGEWFYYLHDTVKPHIVATAKGLGKGVPMGACVMREKGCNLFKPGNHGSSYVGNPLASRVALEVIQVFEDEDICRKVKINSKILHDKLQVLCAETPEIKMLRGTGYMLGIEFSMPIENIKHFGLQHKILLNVTAQN